MGSDEHGDVSFKLPMLRYEESVCVCARARVCVCVFVCVCVIDLPSPITM